MSVEKNQLFKVGDKVKILPTILSDYPDFPYVGVIGRVCAIDNNNDSIIAVEFSHPHNYLHDCGGVAKQHSGWYCRRKYLKVIPDNLPDIWEYIK